MQIYRNSDKSEIAINFIFFKITLTEIIMQILKIFFKIRLTKVSNENVYTYKQFYIFCKIILNKGFLVFKTQGLYCHELIYYKWVNLQKLRYWDES